MMGRFLTTERLWSRYLGALARWPRQEAELAARAVLVRQQLRQSGVAADLATEQAIEAAENQLEVLTGRQRRVRRTSWLLMGGVLAMAAGMGVVLLLPEALVDENRGDEVADYRPRVVLSLGTQRVQSFGGGVQPGVFVKPSSSVRVRLENPRPGDRMAVWLSAEDKRTVDCTVREWEAECVARPGQLFVALIPAGQDQEAAITRLQSGTGLDEISRETWLLGFTLNAEAPGAP